MASNFSAVDSTGWQGPGHIGMANGRPLTSRQRVLAALNHEQPDRVAVDFGSHLSSGIAGMDEAGLKRDFGAQITFWGGGCDTHKVLTFGTPEQVRRHVREQVAILAPGGGFVFQQVHNILANVPPENIIAMFDALRDSE